MDQVKKGSKTLLDFFSPSVFSLKKCKSNKGLDSPTLQPSHNESSYATASSEIGKSHYLHSDKNLSDNYLASK